MMVLVAERESGQSVSGFGSSVSVATVIRCQKEAILPMAEASTKEKRIDFIAA
jgi:hypothetical protein